MRGDAALAVGPLSNAKLATSVMAREEVHNGVTRNTTWEMGVSSEVVHVGRGFVHRTLLVTDLGPTRAMKRWGTLLRREHQARPSLIPSLCTQFTRAGIEWRRCQHAVCMARPYKESHHSG